MASTEISRAKTIFVLAIVVGCFAVLWPKVFYPMFQGGVAPEAQHKDEPICCGVVFEMDTYLQLVCTHVLHKDLRFARGSVARQALQECRENLMENCKIDIRSPDYRPSQNLTICLRDIYGVDDKKLHHRPNGSVHIPRHMKPERPAHLHPEVMHPGLREKGRTIPPSHDIRNGRPPIGVRPPMGAGAHVSNTQKGVGVGGGGAMSILMPLYTIGIVVFFVYTVMKVLFKKQPESDEPKIKDFGMDPEHRKFLYEAKIDEPEISTRAMTDMQRATRSADASPIPEPADICLEVSEPESKPVTTELETIPLATEEKATQEVEKAVSLEKEKVEIVEEVVLPVMIAVQEKVVPATTAEPSEVVEEVLVSVQKKVQEEVQPASGAQPTEETEAAPLPSTKSEAEQIAEVVEDVVKPELTENQTEVVEETIAAVKAESDVESSAAKEDVIEVLQRSDEAEAPKSQKTQSEDSHFAARDLEASVADVIEELESDIIREEATNEQPAATNEAVAETPVELTKVEVDKPEATIDVTVETEVDDETKEDHKLEDLPAEPTVIAVLATQLVQSETEVTSVEQALEVDVPATALEIEGLAEPKTIKVELLQNETAETSQPEYVSVESNAVDRAVTEAVYSPEQEQELAEKPESQVAPEEQITEEQPKEETAQASDLEPTAAESTVVDEAEAVEPVTKTEQEPIQEECEAVCEVQPLEEQLKEETTQASEPEPIVVESPVKAETEAAKPEGQAEQEPRKAPEFEAVSEVESSEDKQKEEAVETSKQETVLVESVVASEPEAEATKSEEQETESVLEKQTTEEQPKESVSEPTSVESAVPTQADTEAAESEKQIELELAKEPESATTSVVQETEVQSKQENVKESEEEPTTVEPTVEAKAETGAAEPQAEEQVAEPEPEAAAETSITEQEHKPETAETSESGLVVVESDVTDKTKLESTALEEQPEQVPKEPEPETVSGKTTAVSEPEALSVEQVELVHTPEPEIVSSEPAAINETEEAITVTDDKQEELTNKAEPEGAGTEPILTVNETPVAENEESKPEPLKTSESESAEPTAVVDAATAEADVQPEPTEEIVEPAATPAEPVTDSHPKESLLTAEIEQPLPSSAAQDDELVAEAVKEKPVVEADEAEKVPDPAPETEQPFRSVDPEQTAEAASSQPTKDDTASKELHTPAADTVTSLAETTEQTSEQSIPEAAAEADTSITKGVAAEPDVEKQEPQPSADDDAAKGETSEPTAPKDELKQEEKPTEDTDQPEATVELKPADTEEKAETVAIPEPHPEVPTENEEESGETTATEDKKDGEEPQKDEPVEEKVEAEKPDAPSHMVSIEDDRLLAIEDMIETDMSFFLDTPNIPIAEVLVTPTAVRGVTSRRGSPEEVDEVVEKVVVRPYVIDHDEEAGESVEDLLRQAIGDEIKAERVAEAAGTIATAVDADQLEQAVTDVAVDNITATDESQVVAKSEVVDAVEKTETELPPEPVLTICVPAPEPVEGLSESQTEKETVPQDEAVETNAAEDVVQDIGSVGAELTASSADPEPSANVVGKTTEADVEKEAVNSQLPTGLTESISSEVFPTEYEFLEKDVDSVNPQTEVTNTCEIEAPVEASRVETTNQSTPVGEVSHPLGGTPEASEENKEDVGKFGECCSGTCVQDLIQPEVPQYREVYTDSDVQKRLDDLRKQKELEMDLLRKRLEETEAAMERIVAQMGTASEKLLIREQYDKDLSSTKKRLQEAEEHLEKLKAAKTSEDINELLSASNTSVLDTTILPEPEETKPQEKPSLPFGADAIATSETKISVVGMEVTAQSQDGSKLPRPVTPVKQAAKLNEQGEVTSVLLEALVPTDSQLLVSEAECRAEAVPLEQLDLDESEYEAAPVVLSGKMTLSVMGMELLADPEPPVEHEGDITEADDVTMPSEAVDEKEGSVEPGVVEECIIPEASSHHETAERTTKVRFADTPPQEMIIEEYEDYENENGEPNAEETMTGDDEEDCSSKFKAVVIDTVLEGEHAEAKKDEHPSDEEIKQALSDVKKELAAKRGNNTRADSVDEIMKAVEEARKLSSKPILSESVSADEPLQTFSAEYHEALSASPVVDPQVYGTTEQLATLVQEEAVKTTEKKVDEMLVPETTEEKVTEKSEDVTGIAQSSTEISTQPMEDGTKEDTIIVQIQTTEEESREAGASISSGQDEKVEEPGQKIEDPAVRQEPPSTLALGVVDSVPEFLVTPTEEEKPEDIPTEEDGEQKVSVSTKFLTNLRQDSLRDSASKLKDTALGRSMEITELVIKGPNIEEEIEEQGEEEAEEAESGEIQQSTRVSSQDIKPETKQVVVSTRSNEEPELQTEIENAMKEESLPASKGSSPDMEDFEVVKTEVLTSRLQPTATEESNTLAAEKPAEEGVRSSSTESSSYEMVGNNELGNNHSPSPLESTDSTFVPVSEEKKE